MATPDTKALREAIGKLVDEYEISSGLPPGSIQFFADDLEALITAQKIAAKIEELDLLENTITNLPIDILDYINRRRFIELKEQEG